MHEVSARLDEAAAILRQRSRGRPRLAIVLGSGLGALADAIVAGAAVSYGEVPHVPRSTVEGHAGRFVLGELEGKAVVAMQGRVHYYEGYGLDEITFPIRLVRRLGAEVLFVTNAAGGLNRVWHRGDLMVITDHINFFGANPLRGANDPALGPRFPDMSRAYDPELIALAERAALAEGIALRAGVYAGVPGPSYETPAELRMLRSWGADAVGMSTVPEVIVARHMGMRVLGLTAITDMATGEVVEPVTHEDVIRVARDLEPRFVALARRIVREMRL